jgi:hypothetical protein
MAVVREVTTVMLVPGRGEMAVVSEVTAVLLVPG